MKIQIEVSRPRWLRLPGTLRARGLLTLLLAGLVAVPVAWASHEFGDVPQTNPHHDDISAIRARGITSGCNPPANDHYCPDHAVRRDQMASFLRRGLGRSTLATTEVPTPLTADYQPVLTTPALVTGGTPGGIGYVVVTATASTLDSAETFGTSPKTLELRLHDPGPGGPPSPPSATTLMPTAPSTVSVVGTAALTWRFTVPTGTLRTFQLLARIAGGSPPVTLSQRHMTAVYVPFGGSG